jgi:hypothetical protein
MVASMLAAMTVTGMGGIPEHDAAGSRVLNNHGVISGASKTGWYIAEAAHIASLSLLGITFLLGIACLTIGPGKAKIGRPRRSRMAVGIVLGGLGLLVAWALLLEFTNFGRWLAQLA